MKHTPGPWRTKEGMIYSESDQNGNTIALCRAEANARLIAAAPDLKNEGHDLAVLVLQSDAYKDPDIRDAVDNFLAVEATAEGR